jgi:hypothetical protein
VFGYADAFGENKMEGKNKKIMVRICQLSFLGLANDL